MIDSNTAMNELTLMLAYLTSWVEKPYYEVRRAWKGYDFGVLDELSEQGMIGGTKRAKSLYIGEEGMKEARALLAKYGIADPYASSESELPKSPEKTEP